MRCLHLFGVIWTFSKAEWVTPTQILQTFSYLSVLFFWILTNNIRGRGVSNLWTLSLFERVFRPVKSSLRGRQLAFKRLKIYLLFILVHNEALGSPTLSKSNLFVKNSLQSSVLFIWGGWQQTIIHLVKNILARWYACQATRLRVNIIVKIISACFGWTENQILSVRDTLIIRTGINLVLFVVLFYLVFGKELAKSDCTTVNN